MRRIVGKNCLHSKAALTPAILSHAAAVPTLPCNQHFGNRFHFPPLAFVFIAGVHNLPKHSCKLEKQSLEGFFASVSQKQLMPKWPQINAHIHSVAEVMSVVHSS